MHITINNPIIHCHGTPSTASSLLATLAGNAPTNDAATTAPPQPGQPWPGQGGIYIGTFPAQFGLPAHYLIAAAQDCGRHAWGGHGDEANGADSQVDGRANTAALLADAQKHPAALAASKHSANGHTDFYLPSRFELLLCWLSAPQVFAKEGYYWSSSQYSRDYAWFQAFEYGYSGIDDKDFEHRVRPVRRIHL
jgi:hypothetical protein